MASAYLYAKSAAMDVGRACGNRPTPKQVAVAISLMLGLLFLPAQDVLAAPTVIANISVIGADSTTLGVNPITDRVYVGDFASGTVSVIDTDSHAIVATIPGLKVNPNDGPNDIGANPTTNRIYVGRTVHAGGIINVIDGATNTATAISGVGAHPVSLAVNQTTNRVYVANQLSNTVSVVDGATNTIMATISGFSVPVGVGINPTTNRIYVGGNSTGSVYVIDGATNTVVATIGVAPDPFRIAVDPVSNRIFVTQRSGNSVTVIDGSSNAVIASIGVGTTPIGIDVNPTTSRVYVANIDSDNVSVIDGSTNTVVATVGVGDSPLGVGVNSATGRIYVGNGASGTVSVIEDLGDVTVTTAAVTASADTFVRQGANDTNEGASTFLRLQSSGNNRALVRFDQAAIEDLVGGGTVLTATLEMTITFNANNWGSSGRTVDAHRLTSDWAEGNGFVDGNSPPNRGSGSGATWNCASDGDISDQGKDCSGSTEWEMAKPSQPELHPWVQVPTDTVTLYNDQSGVVAWDVTADVLDFLSGSESNYGWIVRKTQEGQAGHVEFGSKESAAGPRLIISWQ